MAWPRLWLKSPPPLAPAYIAISSCGRSPPPDGGWSSLLVVFASCPAHAFAGRRHKSIGQRGSRPGRHHSVTVGDIIQESRATSSHHTRATSSESAFLFSYRKIEARVSNHSTSIWSSVYRLQHWNFQRANQ